LCTALASGKGILKTARGGTWMIDAGRDREVSAAHRETG
jgi:hypothetical protein